MSSILVQPPKRKIKVPITSEVVVRRPPGRPPSAHKLKNIKREGVVNEPESNENSIELYFAFPIIFKKLYVLYKNINVTDIIMVFEKNRIELHGYSCSSKAVAMTTINASLAHRYYCENSLVIKMSREASEKIMTRIDPKFYESIEFIVKRFTVNLNNMVVILRNNNLKSCSLHEVNVTTDNIGDYLKERWDVVYPLSFKLSKQDFKKYMSDVKSISNTVTIIKPRDHPLYFTYTKEGSMLSVKDMFFDETKIGLVCTHDGIILAATIDVSEIIPISNSQIADEIKLYVHNLHKMMLVVQMDEAVETKILVPIQDHRPH